MKTFKIICTETLIHEFYVNAENKNEAQKKFVQGSSQGKFDFSYGHLESSTYKVEEE